MTTSTNSTPSPRVVATDGIASFYWLAAARFTGRRMRMGAARRSKADVELLKSLIEAGEFRAVIDRVFPMAEVIEAHRYVEGWHKAGNVVLTIP